MDAPQLLTNRLRFRPRVGRQTIRLVAKWLQEMFVQSWIRRIVQQTAKSVSRSRGDWNYRLPWRRRLLLDQTVVMFVRCVLQLREPQIDRTAVCGLVGCPVRGRKSTDPIMGMRFNLQYDAETTA